MLRRLVGRGQRSSHGCEKEDDSCCFAYFSVGRTGCVAMAAATRTCSCSAHECHRSSVRGATYGDEGDRVARQPRSTCINGSSTSSDLHSASKHFFRAPSRWDVRSRECPSLREPAESGLSRDLGATKGCVGIRAVSISGISSRGRGARKNMDIAVLRKDDEVLVLKVGDRVDDHLILEGDQF